MANLKYSSEILDDILFRGGESTDGTSDYEAQALVYLNRAYRSLCMGGTEFDSAVNEIWWWLKSASTFTLEPSIKTGSVSVTNNSTSITFSSAPSSSVAGYFFKADNHPDVFKISAHTASDTAATLDSVYTGSTDGTASYRVMKLEYDIPSDAIKIVSPMRAYQDSKYEIDGMDLRSMTREYPNLNSGVPDKFAMIDENTIRFNRFGDDNGGYIRVDYEYYTLPTDLTDSNSEEPLVPLIYRHVLADMALYFIQLDKDDDKAAVTLGQAKAGIRAMANENFSRWSQMGDPGEILPRQSQVRNNEPLRTESGVIIG